MCDTRVSKAEPLPTHSIVLGPLGESYRVLFETNEAAQLGADRKSHLWSLDNSHE